MRWEAYVLFLATGAILFELLTRFGITRRVLRELTRFFIVTELGALELVQIIWPPRYVLRGQCQQRGDCCKMIVGDPPNFIKKSRLLRVFVAYHRLFHNFHVMGRGPNEEVIFECHYLQSDGRCGIYKYRPLLCRNYPILPFYDPPRVIPGCGYVVTPRVVDTMRPRASLPILNPTVAVHHPTRDAPSDRLDVEDDFELATIVDVE